MSDYKILNHPDREEIIQKLLSGISPNNVSIWLQEKYPDEKENHITFATISLFRKNYLNLNREAVRQLKKERQKKELGLPHNANLGSFIERPGESEEEHTLRVKDTLLQSPTYRDKLKEITEATLDGPRLIKQLVALLQSRLEVYFNEIASATSAGQSLKTDKMFAEYVSLMKDLIKDSKKIEEDYSAQPDDGVVQLNVVHEQVAIIRETVKEMLGDFSPDLALEFMDRLNKKMSALRYETPRTPDILERVEKLNQKIKEIREQSSE